MNKLDHHWSNQVNSQSRTLHTIESLKLWITTNKIRLIRILTLLVIGDERFRDGLTDSWKHIHTWKSESCTLGADYLCNLLLICYKTMNKGRIYCLLMKAHFQKVSTRFYGDQSCCGLDNEKHKLMCLPELYIFNRKECINYKCRTKGLSGKRHTSSTTHMHLLIFLLSSQSEFINVQIPAHWNLSDVGKTDWRLSFKKRLFRISYFCHTITYSPTRADIKPWSTTTLTVDLCDVTTAFHPYSDVHPGKLLRSQEQNWLLDLDTQQ